MSRSPLVPTLVLLLLVLAPLTARAVEDASSRRPIVDVEVNIPYPVPVPQEFLGIAVEVHPVRALAVSGGISGMPSDGGGSAQGRWVGMGLRFQPPESFLNSAGSRESTTFALGPTVRLRRFEDDYGGWTHRTDRGWATEVLATGEVTAWLGPNFGLGAQADAGIWLYRYDHEMPVGLQHFLLRNREGVSPYLRISFALSFGKH